MYWKILIFVFTIEILFSCKQNELPEKPSNIPSGSTTMETWEAAWNWPQNAVFRNAIHMRFMLHGRSTGQMKWNLDLRNRRNMISNNFKI